jgi:hypothetical protein
MILLKNGHYKEDEKLFSTGNPELDDILEEVYYSGISDGYNYAQREFAEKRETKTKRKELSKEDKAAMGAGTITFGAGSLAASIANEAADRKADERYSKSLKAIEKNAEEAEAKLKESDAKKIQNLKKAAQEQIEKVPKASAEEIARVEKANKYILEGPNRPLYDALKLNLGPGSAWLEKTSEEKGKEAIKEGLERDIDEVLNNQVKKQGEIYQRACRQNDEAMSRVIKRMEKNRKIGNKRKLIAVGASVPAALVAREVVKRKNKKNKDTE